MSEILNYKVTLEVLGPLFIGNGNKIQKSEYIYSQEDSRVYVMDPLKMFKRLKEINLLRDYENMILREVRNFNLYNFIKEYDIKLSEYRKWAAYSYEVDRRSNFLKADIFPFVKDAYNMPYVPGSSLKGAIRTAVLNEYLMTNSDEFCGLADKVKKAKFEKRDKYLKCEAEEINVKALHRLKRNLKEIKSITNDMFYGLKVSDSKPVGLENLTICEKQDISPRGKTRKINVQRECLKPGTKLEFEIEIDTKFFPFDSEKLCNVFKIMYNNMCDVFLSKFKVSIKKEFGNLIYIGGGVGFVSKTADYSLFPEKKEAVEVVSVILNNIDSKQKSGKHLEDSKKYGVSPHMRKCTTYGDRLYDFGLCRIDFKPM